ncbi:MAG: dipeptide epimerase, partial [Cytophagales bacterium]|nr:dipeptide epimerase [Cytophagales bacterium]
MITGTYEKLTLGLKYTWAISRGATNEKTNFIIYFRDEHGNIGHGEVAPNTRYGESLEGVESQLSNFLATPLDSKLDVPGFCALLDSFTLYNSVRFGLEAAFISLYCSKLSISFPDFFQIPRPNHVFSAYTIPIMEVGQMEGFYREYNLSRFKTLKIKIGAENGMEMIQEVSRFSYQPMIVDANEAYQDP